MILVAGNDLDQRHKYGFLSNKLLPWAADNLLRVHFILVNKNCQSPILAPGDTVLAPIIQGAYEPVI